MSIEVDNKEVRIKEKPRTRWGFLGDGEYAGKIFLQRCPKCGLENWALAVATGNCAWCGYEGKEEDVTTNY